MTTTPRSDPLEAAQLASDFLELAARLRFDGRTHDAHLIEQRARNVLARALNNAPIAPLDSWQFAPLTPMQRGALDDALNVWRNAPSPAPSSYRTPGVRND